MGKSTDLRCNWCPVKATKVVRGLGASDLSGEAEGARLDWPGEEKAKSCAGVCLPLHNQGSGEARPQLFPAVHRGKRKRGRCHKLCPGQLGLHTGTNSSSWEV